jgi:hypothetical protein
MFDAKILGSHVCQRKNPRAGQVARSVACVRRCRAIDRPDDFLMQGWVRLHPILLARADASSRVFIRLDP